ncbi:hypothetical protein BDV93DRAFT_528076 [Ceratobasidium sp. AG-I]|nr:hypothetical protein BDV93DRAFT_528076 [Ceratobasidium sp. AG-I]
MLSANAANVGGGNALYSNPLFSTLFPNHPGLSSGDNGGGGGGSHSASNGAGENKAELWPTLGRSESNPAPVSSGGGGGGTGDTSWLSFLGTSRGSQPPSDDVDLSSLFPFDPSGAGSAIGVGAGSDIDDDERGGKRAKR